MSTYSTWERPWAPLAPEVRAAAEWLFDAEVPEVAPVGLLVGEQPGPSSNPKLPLWPYPPRSAGGRLHAMSGMEVPDYLERLARVNLARRPVASWDDRAAALRLHALLTQLPEGARVVLCGARARNALGDVAWFEPFLDWNSQGVDVVAVPHPSGRCREYNDPAAKDAAGRAVRWAARLEE